MKKKWLLFGFVSSFAVALAVFLSVFVPVFNKREDVDVLQDNNIVLGDEIFISNVYVNILDDFAYSNNNYDFTVNCLPEQPIKGYEFDVSFDSSLIFVESVNEGNIFNGHNTLFNSGNIDNTNGTISNVYGLIVGDETVKRKGSFAEITFITKTENGTANFNLSNVGVTNKTDYVNINIMNDSLLVINSPEAFITETFDIKSPSFGMTKGSITSTNYSFFWEKFKKHSAWQLEAWHPIQEIWVSEWQGTNLNEWLTITKERSEYNNSEKVTLNVTNHHPTQDLYFRFTFGIDLRVKQYVNKSSNYEYSIVYPINDFQNYTVFFNFTDVKPLIQNGVVIPKHGIRNYQGKDIFFFRLTQNMSRNPLKSGKSFEIDPIFGDETKLGTQTNINDYLRGFQPQTQAPSNGTADNIFVYLGSFGSGDDVKCALYEGNNFIGGTEEITDGLTEGWSNFDFVTKPEINTTTDYRLLAWADGTVYVYYSSSSGDNYHGDSETYGDWPDPASFSTSNNYAVSIYCLYTQTGQSWVGSRDVDSNLFTNTEYIISNIYTVPNDGTAHSMSVFVDPSNTNQRLKGAIYEYVDESSVYAGACLGETEEYDFTGSEGAQWFEMEFKTQYGNKPFPIPLNASTKYYFVYQYETSGVNMRFYRTTHTNETYYEWQADYDGTWQDPWDGEQVDTNKQYAMFCTYNLTEEGETWNEVTAGINGTYSNITAWYEVTPNLNGTYSNFTTWKEITPNLNGSYSNITAWYEVTPNINGSYSNLSNWYVVTPNINGTYSNSTTWKEITPNINGSYHNSTAWYEITPNINGSYSNITSWNEITPNINGTYSNTSNWFEVTPNINGSYHNVSNWVEITPNINGTYSNSTNWVEITPNINGSYSNITGWYEITPNINGSYSNSTTWKEVTPNINGSYHNTSNWNAVTPNINGSYSNISTWNEITSNINGTYSNSTNWNAVTPNINGSYHNTSNWYAVTPNINGSYSNLTNWYAVTPNINGTYSNVSTTWQEATPNINGSYHNTSVPNVILITNIYPSNNSLNIPLQPFAYALFNSTLGNKMNISWYNDTTLLGTDSDVDNGTHNELFLPATASNTQYTLNITVNDGEGNWANETITFTTAGAGSGGITMIGDSNRGIIFVFSIIGFIGILGLLGIRRRKRKGGGGQVRYGRRY